MKFDRTMPFSSWLQLLFLALKLTGHIGWSWWFIVMPIIYGTLAQVYMTYSEEKKG